MADTAPFNHREDTISLHELLLDSFACKLYHRIYKYGKLNINIFLFLILTACIITKLRLSVQRRSLN